MRRYNAIRRTRRGGRLPLALIINKRDFPAGMEFWGSETLPLQFGSCIYQKGKVLLPHIHKVRPRIPEHKTLEFLYIIRGSMEATFYSPIKELVSVIKLVEGDCVMLYDGGHGFKVLEDDTVFIEVKNGPYVSVEVDKEKF